jgi:hypothetical protein
MALSVPPIPGRPGSVGVGPRSNDQYQPGYIAPYPQPQGFMNHPSYSTGNDHLSSDPSRAWGDHHPSSSSRVEHDESLYLAEQRKKWEIEWKDHEYAKQLASDQEREERELVQRFERGMGVGVGRGMGGEEARMGGYPAPPPPFVVPPEPRGYEGYTGQRHSGTYSGTGSQVGSSATMPDPKDYQRRRQEAGTGGPVVMQPGQVYERYTGGHGHPPYPHPQLYPYPQPPPPFQVSPHPHAQGRPHTHTSVAGSSAEERRHSTPTSARPRPPRSRGDRSLRPLHVPISLIPTFLRIASSHTQRGIEMCGLLLGTIRPPSSRRSNKEPRRHSRSGSGASIAQSVLGHQEEEEGELVVQAVLIPRQEGTSDTCTMKEEERVVGVQLERGLIALGWVSGQRGMGCRFVAFQG